jgi:hypothetical protein
MSAASDYLTQQMTLAASQGAPIVTFASCQRSLAPKASSIEGRGLATFGWGIGGQIHKNAAGQADGLHFGEVHQWFSDRFTPSSSLHPPDLQYFRGGSGNPPHNNRDTLTLTFTLAKLPRFELSPVSRPDNLSGHRGGLVEWVNGDTVVELKVVLWSWRTGTSVASAPTWNVSTSAVDGPSQQLVFNIPGSFKIPGASSAPHGDAPAVMLTSFNNQGAFAWL